MYFVRSGLIYLPKGSLRAAGNGGYFWLSVAYPANSQYAFGLYFNSTNAYPSDTYNRYYGFSLRNSFFISLYCISSVVASSIFPTPPCVMLLVSASFGHPLLLIPSPTLYHSFPTTQLLNLPQTSIAGAPSPSTPQKIAFTPNVKKY